jgi:hypothetical protein
MAFDPDAYLAGTSKPVAEKPTREQLISQIPGMQGERVPYAEPSAQQEGRMARIGRRAMESVSALPPTVAAPALALGAVSRVPQAVRGLAGPVERGITQFAKAMTPTTGRGLRQAATSAGIAGGAGEIARQAAETGGAGTLGQTAAEFAGQMAPSAARASAARGVASLAEKTGKRLYSIPEEIKTPELQRILNEANKLGITILPSQIRDSRGLKATERILQLLPGSASQFREFGRKNQQSINEAVTKEFGSAEPNVVYTVVQNALKNAGAQYDDILLNKTFSVPQKTKNDLNELFALSEELRKFNAAKPDLSKFTQALASKNTINSETWQKARSAVSTFVSAAKESDRELGSRVLELFDDVAKNNLSKKDYETLKGVDKLYSAIKTYEDIYRATGGAVERAGDIDIKRFAQGYIQQQPKQVQYQKETGRGAGYVPLSTVGKTFDVFTRPRVPETQATTLPGLARTTTGMSLLGGGLYSGLDAATLAGAGLLASRPLAGQIGQFYLNPEEYARALRQIGVSPYAAVLPTITRE